MVCVQDICASGTHDRFALIALHVCTWPGHALLYLGKFKLFIQSYKCCLDVGWQWHNITSSYPTRSSTEERRHSCLSTTCSLVQLHAHIDFQLINFFKKKLIAWLLAISKLAFVESPCSSLWSSSKNATRIAAGNLVPFVSLYPRCN
jgi:hypothetical protein